MKFFISFCLCLFFSAAGAQLYSALLISEKLRTNASVVKRFEEQVLTIHSPSKYTIHEKHVYTILNASAQSYARYITSYDQFSSISNLSGVLYNTAGAELKHTKKKDWEDNSAYDGFSLLTDSRYKKNEFFYSDYPFTVEYEEEDEVTGTLYFPRWTPQNNFGMSVELSRYTIIAPADYKVRYKPVNFTGEPVITEKGASKLYTWEIKNLPAKKSERDAPSFREIAPSVIFGPSDFEVSGYKGNMNTWESYGKFMYQLKKGRDILPDNIKKKVHELTDQLTDPGEKISVLYDFLQQNTRYVSVQLGIGGWQPFEAAYVAQNKYGDCKALSNYMIALLKEAGINGKYVEIYAGSSPPPFIDDFPCLQSNHVISCVPLGKDTVWLECTSQTKSPGYMGSFTGNRKAILIDEDGAHIVHTPVYKAADNLQLRSVKAAVDAEGNADAEIENTYTGLQQDFVHSLMYEISPEERQKHLNTMFDLPTYEVIKSEYREQKGFIPAVNEKLKIKLSNYASITGKRLFLTPGLFGSSIEKLTADTARQFEYVVKNGYTDIDTVEIKIPAGYKPESIAKDVSLQTKYGRYSASVKFTGDKVFYCRSMQQNSGRFPPAEYSDIVKFYEQVYKADRAKLVLVKAE
ncbi:MAG: DUF3857 domain-containing protein [Ferruginibacter sp.]